MKALTLHQPHAHLIGRGVKIFETRSWKTNYRGLLAIHAAKIQRHELDDLVVNPWDDEPTYLEPYGHYLPATWNGYFGDLNHGGIEALVVLKNCIPGPAAVDAITQHANTCPPEHRDFCKHSASFGDFSPGRWAWQLEIMATFAGNRGGVVRGYQGLWTLPEDTETILLQSAREELDIRLCRVCGCTDDAGCVTGDIVCHWVEDHLCSACVRKEAA